MFRGVGVSQTSHTVYFGEVLRGLAGLPDQSVHAVVTSPPYFGLRSYLPDDHPDKSREIGLEETPDAYVARMVTVFREVRRVLRDDGTLWLNLGDSYTSGGRSTNGTREGYKQQTNRGSSGKCDAPRPQMPEGLKPKDLIGIPWRVAFALQADGWYLRSAIPWVKCLSGGVSLYAKTQNGVAHTMIKDLARLDHSTVQLWNGEKWTQVLSITESEHPGPGNQILLVLRSGERIACTPNHVWPTERGEVRADALVKGDRLLSCRLPEPEEVLSPENLPDEEVGWFIGTYLADGSFDRGDSTSIQIASHIDALLPGGRFDRLQKIARTYGGTCAHYQTSDKGITINLHGKVLVAIIGTYLAGETSAKTKHLKPVCWRRSDAFLKALLMGYLEGDGHYDAQNDRWRLGFTRNYYLEQSLRTLCARIGARLVLNPGVGTYNGEDYPLFRGEIRFTVRTNGSTRYPTEIMRIERGRARQFWDIAVEDEPHHFALASGVLTHNSNTMPESVIDRPTVGHEYWFLLAKSGTPVYWTHRDGAGQRTPPEPDYRWTDRSTGEEAAAEPEGWRDERMPDGTKRWRRTNLWRGVDYYYDADAVRVAHSPESVARVNRTHHTAGHKWEHGPGDQTLANDLTAALSPNGRNRRTTDWWHESVDALIADLEGYTAHLKAVRANRGACFGPAGEPMSLNFSTKPFKGAHFATFNVNLITPLIRISTSEKGCCPVCGAPWRRVTERAREHGATPDAGGKTADLAETDRWNRLDRRRKAARAAGEDHSNPFRHGTTLGWQPTCTCSQDNPVPCTVLDPFMGSGTVAEACKALGRSSIGCDIDARNQEYIERRLQITPSSLEQVLGLAEYRFVRV